jgi:hypothetical protein
MRWFAQLLFAILIAAGCGSEALAQKYLTGELAGTYPAGEYSISGNIYVLPKTTLTFEAGCILRFDNFTGIIVRGTLVCKGTAEEPVILTSSRDLAKGHSAAEAFDWNGVKVTEEAQGATLEYCTISYSTFGLNVESAATPVSLKEIIFKSNGSASLTREKKMLAIVDNVPVNQTWPEAGSIQPPDTVRIDSLRPPKPSMHPKWVKPARIGCGVLAVGGCALWIGGHLTAQKYDQKAQEQSKIVPTNRDLVNSYVTSRNNAVTVRNIGLGLFGAGLIGFGVTFLF